MHELQPGADTRVVGDPLRLMQFAVKSDFPLVVDNATRYATRLLLSFRSLEPIMVKGKRYLTRLFVPVNESAPIGPDFSVPVVIVDGDTQPYRQDRLRPWCSSGRGCTQRRERGTWSSSGRWPP